MASNYTEWQLNLVDSRLQRPISDSTGQVCVMTAGSPALATLFSDDRGTSLTQPITFASGSARFFTDVATTSLDFTIVTAAGQGLYLTALGTGNHRIVIDPDRMEQAAPFPFAATASGVVAKLGGGMNLTTAMRVYDAFLRISTSDSTATGDFGVSSSVTGFVSTALLTTTGYRLVDQGTVAAGFKGALVANPATATVYNMDRYYVAANATSGVALAYQHTTAGTGPSGYLWLRWLRLPTA